VLGLVRFIKNTIAPINRIPSEVLSLIPDHSSFENKDTELIALTHVCRGWREIFTSRSSLWATLGCEDVEKTRVYLERSKSSPLNVYLTKTGGENFDYSEDALRLVVPHISRLSTLMAWGTLDTTQDLTRYFSRPAPVLRTLDISLPFACVHAPTFPATLFNGDISSVRELCLTRFTQLPWRNMSNLEIFELRHDPGTVSALFLTQLLDLFESAPLLSRVELKHFIPVSSNAPSGRVVPIPHLKKLNIISSSGYYTLLEHLSIPTGASLMLHSPHNGDNSPILDHLPKNFNNLNNLSHITSVSLRLGPEGEGARLNGPSGELYLYGTWVDGDPSSDIVQRRLFSSLERFNPFSTQKLGVTKYTSSQEPEFDKSPIFQTLLLMNDLRILTLIECNNLPFIHALNPEKNDSGNVACPRLEELILYIKKLDWFYASELKEMVSARAERCAKRPAITIVTLSEMLPEEVFTLRQYFPRVEFKVDVEPPEWDTFPGDGNGDERD